MVDWNRVYLDLLEYKDAKGLSNLLIQPGLLRLILEAGEKAYLLEADESVVKPKGHDDHLRLQEAVANILRKYADALYRRRQAAWESNNLTYRQLDHNDDNFRFNLRENGDAGQYIVRVSGENTSLVREIAKLIDDWNVLNQDDLGALRQIHFDRHLYQTVTDRNRRRNFVPTLAGGK